MSDRVTPAMLSASTLQDINSAYEKLQRSSAELSSGKKILEPSDEPYGASRIIALQSQLDGLTSYASSVQDGTGWVDTAAGALSNISSALERVRELLVQASNGTLSESSLDVIGDEVTQLTEAIKQDANAQYAGQYVFSGTATSTPPYASGEDDAYGGNEEGVARAIAPGVTLAISSNLGGVLGSGTTAGDGKLLDVLRTIAAHLTSPNASEHALLGSSDLEALNSGIEAMRALQASAGSTVDQLQTASTRVETLQSTITQALSSVSDANIAEVTINYSNEQAAYDAALRAGARIVQESLLEFLS